jgi:hypothetical protein
MWVILEVSAPVSGVRLGLMGTAADRSELIVGQFLHDLGWGLPFGMGIGRGRGRRLAVFLGLVLSRHRRISSKSGILERVGIGPRQSRAALVTSQCVVKAKNASMDFSFFSNPRRSWRCRAGGSCTPATDARSGGRDGNGLRASSHEFLFW